MMFNEQVLKWTFWEEDIKGKGIFFLAVNMKNGGRRNVSKYKEIKGSDKYVTLEILSKFDSLDKMKITSSELKGSLERSGKGLMTSLGFKTKAKSQKYKNTGYAIRNVSKTDLSKIIKEFEKIEKLPYEKKRPKHESTDSYFHLSIQLEMCMMRSDNLNWHYHGSYREMTAPSLNLNVTDKDKSKRIIVHKSLSENCSTDIRKSKRNIINETLSQKNSTNVSEYTITELKVK